MLLVDENLIRRQAFEHALKTHASDLIVESTHELDASSMPDPTLVVLGLQPEDALSRVESAQQHFPDASLAIIGNSDDLIPTLATTLSSVKGYIPISLPAEIVIAAMRLIIAGGSYIPLDLVGRGLSITLKGDFDENRIGQEVRPPSTPAMREERKDREDVLFTRRERQIVEHLRQGKPNKIIAYELRISEGTVKIHLRNIMRKLKAKNRTQVTFLTLDGKPAGEKKTGTEAED